MAVTLAKASKIAIHTREGENNSISSSKN